MSAAPIYVVVSSKGGEGYCSGLTFAKPAEPAEAGDLDFHAARPLYAIDHDHMARSLFEHIKHGDDEHREWLRVQALAWVR